MVATINGQVLYVCGSRKITEKLPEQSQQGEVLFEAPSWALLKAHPALASLLDACPVLCFTATGIANICNRFRISPEELEGCITALLSENLRQSRPEWSAADFEKVTRTAPEVLEVIRKAVSKPGRKSATKPKKVREGRANA